MTIEDEKEIVKIKAKNKSLDEIGDESEEKKKKKSNPKFLYEIYESRWNRSSGFKGAMKIARALGAKLKFSGKEKSDPLMDFKENLSEMALEDTQEYVNLLYKISALQPASILEMRGVNVSVPNKPELSGYPEKRLKEALDKDYFKKLEILSQLDVINRLDRENINLKSYKITREKGSEIIEDYVEEELQEKLKEVVDENRGTLPLIYSYLHDETLSWNPIHQDLLNISSDLSHKISKRAMEYDHMRDSSLIGSIIKKNTNNSLISIEGDQWYGEDDEMIANIRKFWDDMENLDLAVNAPKIKNELQINPEGANDISQVERVLNHVDVTEDHQRSMPIKVAEELYRMISNELNSKDKKTRILMIINKYREMPKTVKTTIKKEKNDYNLSDEDLTEVEKVVNQLAKKEITSQWSKSGEVPFVMKDYDEFLDSCQKYLLEEEELSLKDEK